MTLIFSGLFSSWGWSDLWQSAHPIHLSEAFDALNKPHGVPWRWGISGINRLPGCAQLIITWDTLMWHQLCSQHHVALHVLSQSLLSSWHVHSHFLLNQALCVLQVTVFSLLEWGVVEVQRKPLKRSGLSTWSWLTSFLLSEKNSSRTEKERTDWWKETVLTAEILRGVADHFPALLICALRCFLVRAGVLLRVF